MTKVPQRDPIRDNKLIKEYNQKNDDGSWTFKTSVVAYHFDMSSTRLYQILDFYEVPRRTRK